jgi:hypothetical protein
MPYIDIEMDVFDDDDLIEELEDRGYKVSDSKENKIHKELFQLLKSYQCDNHEVFMKNMQIFYDRWYSEL